MNDDKNKHWGDTEFGQGIAFALVILALCLGVGGCIHLASTITL